MGKRREGWFRGWRAKDFESPVWSPDSHWIAYLHSKIEGRTTTGTSIEILSANGGPSKTAVSESSLVSSGTLNTCWGGCLYWTANWNLVFAVQEDSETLSGQSKSSLWQIRVNPDKKPLSQAPRQLDQWTDLQSADLTASSDGKILAVRKYRFHQDVYVGDLEPSLGALKTTRRFTLDNHDSTPEDWTHDNRSLLFASNRNGKWELFKQGLNDSVAERIVSSSEGGLGGGNGLSPDGSWILYWEFARLEGKAAPAWARIVRQPVAGGSPETVLEVPYSEGILDNFLCPQKPGHPCVLSTMERKNLVFYAFDPLRGKGDSLGKIEVDTSGRFGWAVSPDGSQLAVVDYSHKEHIEILDLSNRTWHETAMQPGAGLNQSVAWAADGKGWFMTTWLPESFNLIHVTPSGKVQPLVSNSHRQWMAGPRPSPDGKHLAFQAQTWDSNVWLMENF